MYKIWYTLSDTQLHVITDLAPINSPKFFITMFRMIILQFSSDAQNVREYENSSLKSYATKKLIQNTLLYVGYFILRHTYSIEASTFLARGSINFLGK